MSWYFIVDTYIDKEKGRGEYDDYILQVKPIVEKYNGKYLARSENIISLSQKRNPKRVIIIEFKTKEDLEQCFSSVEYKAIMSKRISSVDSRAIIVEGLK